MLEVAFGVLLTAGLSVIAWLAHTALTQPDLFLDTISGILMKLAAALGLIFLGAWLPRIVPGDALRIGAGLAAFVVVMVGFGLSMLAMNMKAKNDEQRRRDKP